MAIELEVKRPDQIVPSYSLTGDMLAYQRCRLQYRYHNRSSLPPSRPVQLWFGDFLHGTLEFAYRFWEENNEDYPFPWPCNMRDWRDQGDQNWAENDIGLFGDTIEQSLARQGKQARSTAARNSAYLRVSVAINELGPHLFPLIALAEKKVIGTRAVPESTENLRCDNYELHGIIDVLTNLELGAVDDSNLIRRLVEVACPGLEGEYEVIVDYKGSQRPRISEPYWAQGEWQLQTYAWLRNRQPDSMPVAAGILIYINELSPGNKEMTNLKRGIQYQDTDIWPEPGSQDEQLIRMWREGNSTDQISLEFKLRRAIRIVPISQGSIQTSLTAFDEIVRNIEEDIVAESADGDILEIWEPSCEDESTCVACDFRYFCPQPAGVSDNYEPTAPSAP